MKASDRTADVHIGNFVTESAEPLHRELAMTEMADLELAGEFEPASREQWLELVGKVLKGASLEDKLVSRTYDGI
ncbi:MAG TPA: hypothetical protein DEG43_02900, partial [Acidimicrobiaceae bacterium]|nr:hypothetical protein [Acidimicrobiaceae bacterium]